MKTILPIVLFCTLLCFSSCGKFIGYYPNPVVTCKINGIPYKGEVYPVWTPGMYIPYMRYSCKDEYFKFGFCLYMIPSNGGDFHIQSMHFKSKKIPAIGEKFLVKSLSQHGNISEGYASIITLDSVVSGYFTFDKLDLTNQIFSGSFEYAIVNDLNDTLKVTEGRFYGERIQDL